MSCLNFPLLENLTSSTLSLRLLKFFPHLTEPFQVNVSCRLTGDQSVFIQLYTKWDLLCVSLLGLCHPLNFCSVEKYKYSASRSQKNQTHFHVGS